MADLYSDIPRRVFPSEDVRNYVLEFVEWGAGVVCSVE